MNIIIQNNNQLQSIEHYISTNGYRIKGDYPSSIDSDLIFSIDENDKSVTCSLASHMLLDSNNSIYSIKRFFDIKSKEPVLRGKADVEKNKQERDGMHKLNNVNQITTTKSLSLFFDLAMKANEYPPEKFKNLLTSDLFDSTKSSYDVPSNEVFFYKNYPGLTFSIQDSNITTGVLQNTLSDSLALQYYNPKELRHDDIRPILFTKENIIKYVKEVDFSSMTNLNLFSILPMQFQYDKDITRIFYEKIEELSFIIPKHLSEQVPDIASPALYPYASIYFLDLLKVYSKNQNGNLMENGMQYMNEHFADEMQQLYEHYEQLNYYCDHIDVYKRILEYNLEYPSIQEKETLRRSVFQLKNAVSQSSFDYEVVKGKIVKAEEKISFFSRKSKKNLSYFIERKETLEKRIEQNRAKLVVENDKYIELVENEKLTDSKISEEGKNLKYEFEILHDTEVLGTLSLKLAMFPTLNSHKIYLDLIQENYNSIKLMHERYSAIKENYIDLHQIPLIENDKYNSHLNSKSDIEIDI